MPSSDPDKIREKRQRDNERRREKRTDPAYREDERRRDRERKRRERKRDSELYASALANLTKDWETFDWENEYIRKRNSNEAYRPWLQALHDSDRERGTIRLNVYKTTPLDVEERKSLFRVWQTSRSATVQVPGLPLIKYFKVIDHTDPNPVPIGEGELVRRYLRRLIRRMPKSTYENVVATPKYFVPKCPSDLLEWECEYIDLHRCYSQLLGRLPSLCIHFDYGRRLFEPIDSLPPNDNSLLLSKHWGRATIGMLQQRLARCFIYGEPKTYPSKYFHGDTCQWVMAVLHCLASYAIQYCGCFRWHTDGGFFPPGGGVRFSRLLNNLGIEHSLEEYAAVIFASLDQYEAIRKDGSVKQTKLFTSTYVSDFIFLDLHEGGSQRNNIIHDLNSSWLFSTLEV